MYIPKQYKQTYPGVIERIEYFPSKYFYDNHNDLEEYRRIIDVDLPHYQRMFIDNPFPEVVGKYENILSIGGGIPKIEAYYLQAKYVHVDDMKADIYSQLVNYFKKKYNVETAITYKNEHERKLESLYEANVYNRPDWHECVSFVHFLEHLKWKDVEKLISKQTTDIFIYMPNIEAAKNDNWFHFANFAVDHNTFFTMDTMKILGESLGYEVKTKAYKDDMFIWMYK